MVRSIARRATSSRDRPCNLPRPWQRGSPQATLDEHPAVEAVKVKVAKPHVRLDDTVLAGSAVEILRRREPVKARRANHRVSL